MRSRLLRCYTPPSPGEEYRRRLLLWSMSGFWPVSRVQRPNARGYAGCPKEPPPLPEGLSEVEIERIRALLERRGWTLVKAAGRWTPVPTI